ncbi:facilitated trehalose transporter Tret1-2 homolog [Neodiprion fabricii]|uniref:facilitated trehalose transporter Tret1-2 homolog n=1 Tax=Neodiprion fabricii TaxID=2872261 RepID=UPI001ED90FD1|nr:facilitated trehalose transporter Tret1-2 homolog [Neodiprion fabricii]
MAFIRNISWLENVLWLQWFAAATALLMSTTVGLMFGWTSPYLLRLTAEDSELPITPNEGSWVASLLNLGRFLGAFVGGFCVEYLGSKQTLTALGVPLIMAWICIMVADSVNWLYVARILGGISVGMSFSSFPLYLGEVSSPTIRGTVVTLAMSGFSFGTTIGNAMGVYLSMKVFAYVSIVPSILFVLIFLWIPQSPHYLVRIGKLEQAEKSIARYNPGANSKLEVQHLKEFVVARDGLSFMDRMREMNIPRNRQAMIISIMLFFFMQFSGMNSLVYYMEITLTDAGITFIAPATLVIILGVLGIAAGWVSIFIADKFRRKALMIVSSAGVGVSMAAYGTHFALLDGGFDPEPLQWLPVTAGVIFLLFICIGIIPVPNMILSEIFAPNIKSVAACFASISIGLFAFAASRSYQPLVDVVGESWVFWLHSFLMVLSIIFAAIWMPETKGKTLQEIQNNLSEK